MTKKQFLTILIALAVLVPTAVNLYPLYDGVQKLKTSMVFRLPVTGFDPRDFSRGRYAQLRLVPPAKKCFSTECAICVEKNSNGDAYVTTIPYAAHRSCPLVVSQEVWETPLRVYLDERSANSVDAMLSRNIHRFTADIVFPGGQKPVLRQFYINDVPYHTFIKDN